MCTWQRHVHPYTCQYDKQHWSLLGQSVSSCITKHALFATLTTSRAAGMQAQRSAQCQASSWMRISWPKAYDGQAVMLVTVLGVRS